MDKILYTDVFAEPVEYPEERILVFNGKPLTVTQYLPLEKKMDVIQNVVNICAFDKLFLNSPQVLVIQTIEMVKAYTNIEFTDDDLKDAYILYDTLEVSGLIQQLFVEEYIPSSEQAFITQSIYDTLVETFKYNNSAQGIIRNIIASSQNNMVEIEDLIKKVKDPAIGEFLKKLADSKLV